MDLRLFGRALAHHRTLTTLGLLAAIGLAFLASVRVAPLGNPVFQYRSGEKWSSKVSLQIGGFPEGSIVDPRRQNDLATLAPLYAQLANSNSVKRIMRASGPVPGEATVSAIIDSNSRASLPIIEIVALTATKDNANQRAVRQARAFIAYIAEKQTTSAIPPSRRVSLNVIKGPTSPKLAVPRRQTIPILVFLSVLVMVAALALSLENIATRRVRDDPSALVLDEEDTTREGRATPIRVRSSLTSNARGVRPPKAPPVAGPSGGQPDAREESRSAKGGKWGLREDRGADQ